MKFRTFAASNFKLNLLQMLAIFLFVILHWYISLFFQTFYLHRYAAHKQFTLNKFWENVFFFMAYVSFGTSFLSPRAYAILHRMHHAYSDTDKDPHTPHKFADVFKMMWETKKIYKDFYCKRIEPEGRFSGHYPELPKFERFADSYISRLGWAAIYIAFYIHFVPAGQEWLYAFLPINFLMAPIHGAIVNWCGHKYGYRNYESDDHSKNTLVVDFLMMGELYQNNHHHHAMDINFAKKWYEFDPTYPFIKALGFLGVLKIKAKPARLHSK
jgi:stearoyl-CoA desaturase (delta-9 desaturase)